MVPGPRRLKAPPAVNCAGHPDNVGSYAILTGLHSSLESGSNCCMGMRSLATRAGKHNFLKKKFLGL